MFNKTLGQVAFEKFAAVYFSHPTPWTKLGDDEKLAWELAVKAAINHSKSIVSAKNKVNASSPIQ